MGRPTSPSARPSWPPRETRGTTPTSSASSTSSGGGIVTQPVTSVQRFYKPNHVRRAWTCTGETTQQDGGGGRGQGQNLEGHPGEQWAASVPSGRGATRPRWVTALTETQATWQRVSAMRWSRLGVTGGSGHPVPALARPRSGSAPRRAPSGRQPRQPARQVRSAGRSGGRALVPRIGAARFSVVRAAAVIRQQTETRQIAAHLPLQAIPPAGWVVRTSSSRWCAGWHIALG